MSQLRLAILSLLAAGAMAGVSNAQATRPAEGVEVFDPATFPRNGNVAALTPEQRQAVIDWRRLHAPRPPISPRAAAARAARQAQSDAEADAVPLPTTAPTAPLAETAVSALAQLDDRDPEIRQTARTALMSLTRQDLPALRDAAAGRALNVTSRAALFDVVTHIFLTGKHGFQGAFPGYLGISGVPAEGSPPTVLIRTIGYDAYRALRLGDVIVGIRSPSRASASTEVPSLSTLITALTKTRAGDWVTLRVLRDGATIDVDLHVGPRTAAIELSKGANAAIPEAEAYWRREFAPALDAATAATTRAATRPADD